MKKLAFLFVAFAAISLASCGGNQKPAEENADSAAVVVEDSLAGDSVQADSLQADSAQADSLVAPEAN